MGKFKFSGPLHFSQLGHKTRPFTAYSAIRKNQWLFWGSFPPHKKTPNPSCPNSASCFPSRTCEWSRSLQKSTKTIILKKSYTGVRARKTSVSSKRLQVIKTHTFCSTHFECSWGPTFGLTLHWNAQLRPFSLSTEQGREMLRVPKPQRMCVYARVLTHLPQNSLKHPQRMWKTRHEMPNFCPKRQFNHWATWWKESSSFLTWSKRSCSCCHLSWRFRSSSGSQDQKLKRLREGKPSY